MGAGHMDMSRYMEMFMRHSEISHVVEDTPGGVRTTTESNAPDLTAQLQTHVSSMYAHLDQGTEVACMSQSLPTLFHHASGYRRQRTFTPTGVIAEETAEDRSHPHRRHPCTCAGGHRVRAGGMPAMMQQMMGPGGMMGGMGCGGMMGPRSP